MARGALLKAVLSAFLLLACGFLFVLFSSLGNKPKQLQSSAFADLANGATAMRRVAGERLWVTRLDIEQRARLATDHPCKKRALCALPAATSVPGIELAFSNKKPPQLNHNQQWSGGFIDPTNGFVYSIAGTAYSLQGKPSPVDLAPVLVD